MVRTEIFGGGNSRTRDWVWGFSLLDAVPGRLSGILAKRGRKRPANAALLAGSGVGPGFLSITIKTGKACSGCKSPKTVRKRGQRRSRSAPWSNRPIAIDRAGVPFWAVGGSGWPAALSKLNKLHLQFVMLFYRQKTGQQNP